MTESPQWTPTAEAMYWLNQVELVQGGANGPTIKLRAAILAAAVPPGHVVVPLEPSDEWAKAYLDANTEYWIESDKLPSPIGKFRAGTAVEATKAGYRAAMIAARPGVNHG